MVTDINDVAIHSGHYSSKLKNAAHANGNITIKTIADVTTLSSALLRNTSGMCFKNAHCAD